MNNPLKKEIEQKYNVGKKFLRAKEVAEYLGIGISTVWLYAKQGKITAKKLSVKVTVFDVNEINMFLDSLTTPTAQKVA